MDLERIIINLQDKVLTLSDEVDDLKKEVQQLKENKTTSSAKSTLRSNTSKIKGSISKNQLVDAVRNSLSGKIPSEDILKGSRKEGSGIVITKGEQKLKLSLRGSGFNGREDVNPRMLYTGFSTISKKAIVDDNGQFIYNFFVFAVNHSEDAENPEIDFFIFDQDEFNKLLDEKTPSGKNKMYYFYFGETVNHHYIDDRERDKEINLDHEHNDWDKVVKAYEKL